MLLAEDLMLVLVRKTTGELPLTAGPIGALAAALLIELAEHGRLRVADDSLVVVDRAPLGDALLDEASHLAGGTVQESTGRIAPGLQARVLDRLAGHRLVTKVARPVTFGVLSRNVWRLTDPTYRDALRRELALVLLGETMPDGRTGALISLVSALLAVDKVIDKPPASAWIRADEIADGAWPAGEDTLAVTQLCLASAREWTRDH